MFQYKFEYIVYERDYPDIRITTIQRVMVVNKQMNAFVLNINSYFS